MQKEWIYAGQETYTYGSETEETTINTRPRYTPSVPDNYTATEVLFIVDDFRSTESVVNPGVLRWNGRADIQVGNGLSSVTGSTWWDIKRYYFRKLFDGMWVKTGSENGVLELTNNNPKYLCGHWLSKLDAGNVLTITGRTYYR